MSNEHSGGTILGAFLLGGLIGAAAALLTAPKSGRETREDVYRWTDGAATKTRERVQTLANEGGERVRSFASVASERVRDAASGTGEKVKDYVAGARQKFAHKNEDEVVASEADDVLPETLDPEEA